MKITDVLEERSGVVFNDLQPIHIFVLKKVYSGDIDFNNASDKTLDAVDDLIAYGLLTNDEQLTRTGAEMAKHAVERGSLEKREKGLRRRKERGDLKRDDFDSGLDYHA